MIGQNPHPLADRRFFRARREVERCACSSLRLADDRVGIALDAPEPFHPHGIAAQRLRAGVEDGARLGRTADDGRQHVQGAILEAANAAGDLKAVEIDVGAGPVLRRGLDLRRAPQIGRAAVRDDFGGQALRRQQRGRLRQPGGIGLDGCRRRGRSSGP